MKAIALIPARGGSERIKDKNTTRLFGAHPLLAYAISAARDSRCFDNVLVSSDSMEALKIAEYYGADVLKRPREFATATSPDIEWLRHALASGPAYDVFASLRCTSPFRSVDMIRRGMDDWAEYGIPCDSLRAVELVSQHPGKMWRISDNRLIPLLLQPEPQPWHSSQMKTLPKVYVQNASLEIAWTHVVQETNTIAGNIILPFVTQGMEGFDLNTMEDWYLGEKYVNEGMATLPEVHCAPFAS